MTAESVVRRYLAALGAGDVEAAVACVSAGFRNEHTARMGTSVTGRAAYAARLPGFLAEFRELRYEIEDVLADDRRVAVPYTMHFVHVGERPVAVRGVFWFEVADGEITRRVDYWDSAQVADQLS